MSALSELAKGVVEALASLLGRKRPVALTRRKRVERVPSAYELSEEARTHEHLQRLADKKRRSER